MSGSFYNNQIINNEIKSYLIKELKNIGDFRYAYVIMKKNNPSDFCAISNYPDQWADIYIENAYQYIDPVVITALNNYAPFLWRESIMVNVNLKLKKVFDISKKYNVVNGYTFILHDTTGYMATLSILISGDNADELELRIKKNQAQLQMILINTHKKLNLYYKELNANTGHKTSDNKELLSHRENEVLYLASMGKTYPEISAILGITVSTIKFHMGNAVKKLGVFNAKQAIRLSIELQLIKPTDG